MGVAPGYVCGQICLILHRVPEGNQLCLGRPVPLPLGLPAESASIVKTVRQLVQPYLRNAPQVLDVVQISTHDKPQHRLDVALPLDCLGDLGSLSRGVVLLEDQWVVTCVERHMNKPLVLCDVAVGDHSSYSTRLLRHSGKHWHDSSWPGGADGAQWEQIVSQTPEHGNNSSRSLIPILWTVNFN